jgi:histidine triad (HIT) family protein
MASIFTRILKGELPCLKVAENEHTICIFPIAPISVGHSMVIPKLEVNHWPDVPEPYYQAVFAQAKLIAPALQKATGAPRIGLIVQGWEVPHFHLHMVPMWKAADLDFKWAKERSKEEMQDMLEKIKKCLL